MSAANIPRDNLQDSFLTLGYNIDVTNITIIAKKNINRETYRADFFISLIEFLLNKQLHAGLALFRMFITFDLRYGSSNYFAKSTGVLPSRSLIEGLAPLKISFLMMDKFLFFSKSLTAKCRGVKPAVS